MGFVPNDMACGEHLSNDQLAAGFRGVVGGRGGEGSSERKQKILTHEHREYNQTWCYRKVLLR